MKDWDFGYFGKGVEGYMQYMNTFDRVFNEKHTERRSYSDTDADLDVDVDVDTDWELDD